MTAAECSIRGVWFWLGAFRGWSTRGQELCSGSSCWEGQLKSPVLPCTGDLFQWPWAGRSSPPLPWAGFAPGCSWMGTGALPEQRFRTYRRYLRVGEGQEAFNVPGASATFIGVLEIALRGHDPSASARLRGTKGFAGLARPLGLISTLCFKHRLPHFPRVPRSGGRRADDNARTFHITHGSSGGRGDTFRPPIRDLRLPGPSIGGHRTRGSTKGCQEGLSPCPAPAWRLGSPPGFPASGGLAPSPGGLETFHAK